MANPTNLNPKPKAMEVYNVAARVCPLPLNAKHKKNFT